jgi:hypothetical protein
VQGEPVKITRLLFVTAHSDDSYTSERRRSYKINIMPLCTSLVCPFSCTYVRGFVIVNFMLVKSNEK